MKPRVPLYAKILGWFFLNLVLLGTVFALLFNAQFTLNLEWLFTAGARERLEAVRALIIGELNETPPDEWDHVLSRYSEAYQVKFALFDENGQPLVGEINDLPQEVQGRLKWWTDFGRPRRPRDDDSTRGPAQTSTSRGGQPDFRRRGWRPPLRGIVRTTNPTHYWLLTSARIENPHAGDPMRVALLARAESLGSGGLILDLKPWLTVGLGAIVFSLLFWLPLIRGITRSIGQMTHATRQIADGRFDVRVGTRRNDEIGQLGEAVNDMATRLDGFVKGQKRFLGDIAHELCSPLAKLQMALGVLEQQQATRGDGQNKYIRSAEEKAQQIATLVGELLYFSKAAFGASAVHLETVSVRLIAEQAAAQELAEDEEVRVDTDDKVAVTADPELLVRALANLIRNSLRYAADQGPVLITTRNGRGGCTEISVLDFGPGVPEKDLTKIFDAFYRVDTSRTRDTGGVGLGLSIVKTCVDACGGTVAARNRVPHGLEVTLSLPTAIASPLNLKKAVES